MYAFDNEEAPMFTVGQVAGMLHLQPAFLRLLDTESLVQPARSDGGQRRYSRQEIRDVEHVVILKDEGCSLAGIRHILVLEAQVQDLQQQIAKLQGE